MKYHTRPSIGQSAGVAGVCLILALAILIGLAVKQTGGW